MTSATEMTEDSFAKDMATVMGAALEKEAEAPVDLPTYEFDEQFQTKIAALTVKDPVFNRQTEGLVRPEFFENQAEATMVNIAVEYYKKYKKTPDTVVFMSLLKKGFESKSIRSDMKPEIIKAFKGLASADISDRDFVIDEVAQFAKHQALSQAILDSVSFVERRRFDDAFETIKKAMEVGRSEDDGGYDYFKEIESRTGLRKDEAAGISVKKGIPTGMRKFDKLLYHNGWGRKELTVFMGAPKSGKSTALGEYAKCAALSGYNVLYVTLEVSKDIIAERLDANIADIPMDDLGDSIMEIDGKIKIAYKKAGALTLYEYPTGSMTPSMLRRVIAKEKAKGTIFDMVCVDYADIMAPDFRYNSEIENSKSIYIGLRAIAQEEDLAMLSATQTNREGLKSSVARMEHVAEDFNRIRIADLVISINSNEEEKKKGIARLFFAASRNQRGDMTVYVKQDFSRMKFVKEIIDTPE